MATSHKLHRAHTRNKKTCDWGAAFLAAFAITGQCSKAAEAVGIERTIVWHRRQNDEEFSKAYDQAMAVSAASLESEAVRRATEGVARLKFNSKTGEPYIDPDTGKPYVEREYSDMLTLALLRRHFPEKYRERQQVEHTGTVKLQPLSEPERAELIAAKRLSLENRTAHG